MCCCGPGSCSTLPTRTWSSCGRSQGWQGRRGARGAGRQKRAPQSRGAGRGAPERSAPGAGRQKRAPPSRGAGRGAPERRAPGGGDAGRWSAPLERPCRPWPQWDSDSPFRVAVTACPPLLGPQGLHARAPAADSDAVQPGGTTSAGSSDRVGAPPPGSGPGFGARARGRPGHTSAADKRLRGLVQCPARGKMVRYFVMGRGGARAPPTRPAAFKRRHHGIRPTPLVAPTCGPSSAQRLGGPGVSAATRVSEVQVRRRSGLVMPSHNT
jgi:hypothetical protein